MNNEELINIIQSKIFKLKDDNLALTQIFDFLEARFQDTNKTDIKIPKNIQHIIVEIAGAIDIGMICYLNPETNAVIQILPEDDRSMLFGEEQDEELDQELTLIEKWKSRVIFTPLDANELYFIMESFVKKVNDKTLKNKLSTALNHKRPISFFKQLIENSKYRSDWFKFKQIAIEQIVYKKLVNETIAIS